MKNTLAILISGMFITLSAIFSDEQKEEEVFKPNPNLQDKIELLENRKESLDSRIESKLLMQGFVLDTLIDNKNGR